MSLDSQFPTYQHCFSIFNSQLSIIYKSMAFRKDNKIKSNFSKISIGLASPEEILENSSGEVLKPETINYRTYKPERDGLFCERIFGPIKDYECHCGKYKRIRYKGIVCDRCGVEVTEKKVRRERMGHIQLVVPVAHIWYFRSLPNKIGYLLGLPTKKLDAIIYYERYVVIQPGILEGEVAQYDLLEEGEYLDLLEKLPSDNQYLEDSDPNKFVAKMGAEAIYDLLSRIDLDSLSYELRNRAGSDASQQRKSEALKRLQVVESFRASRGRNKPEWMIVRIVPVIPPELRPLVPLDGGRFATSDLNDLYRRVIIRNNRLKRLIEIKAPEVILRNEKRMLQEAVDSLFDNSRKSSAVKTDANRPLKSLSDSLKGKQGRFRQNLLGKRVDYSGRSVIVVGPELKIYQCGLPKKMALELFKPFVMKKLVEDGLAHNIKSAKRMVERVREEVWDVLEDVIADHPVLLNRAPTLHRLGIEAFEPVLVEGKALKLHPLVCTAFNADFDGDQMAVHLPLSAEAQAEARYLMLSANNLIKPQDGKPVTVPTQDMVLGSYYLTLKDDTELGSPREEDGHTVYRVYSSPTEAKLAYINKTVGLHAPIKVRVTKEIDGRTESAIIDATVGRLIFNEKIPQDLGFVDRTDPDKRFNLEIGDEVLKKPDAKNIIGDNVEPGVDKKLLGKIINASIKVHGITETATLLDDVKAMGYKYSTIGAITVGVSDMEIPKEKKQYLLEAEEEIDKVVKNFRRGLLTDDERYQKVINIWNSTSDKVTKALMDNLKQLNPIYMMANSGARGSVNQIRQLAAMRGLMADTSGRTIEIPIRANFREGLTVLEYFISTHGARKGLTDTALRTADSGYLTRRLVDVSQDVIVREHDCGTDDGIIVSDIMDGNEVIEPMADRLEGRTIIGDLVSPETGELIAADGDMITHDKAAEIVKSGIKEVKIRSVVKCRSKVGICSKCYGMNLATAKPVDIGEAVGIIAAQSIGEPGTQLTMRTFHAGGVAQGDDITQGLPRVEELFEARKPKGVAIVTEGAGTVHLSEAKQKREIIVTNQETGEAFTYLIPFGSRIKVREGQEVEAGDPITEGSLNPHDIMAIKGETAVQNYFIQEVQRVYRLQGVDINDKHIEVIVRQMMHKVKIENPGDTGLLTGSLINIYDLEKINDKVIAEGKEPAEYSVQLMGITKAALATESFLSAASFQETTRVLTDAAIKGKTDPLVGLKENVIIGKLVPAGTGMPIYNNIDVYASYGAVASDNNSLLDLDAED